MTFHKTVKYKYKFSRIYFDGNVLLGAPQLYQTKWIKTTNSNDLNCNLICSDETFLSLSFYCICLMKCIPVNFYLYFIVL